MGGLTKRLEDAVKGLALAALLGTSMSASEAPAFAQQQKQERKIQEAPKDNEPDEATQKFREDQIKKLLADDYKKKDAASRSALADKLAEDAQNPNNDSALRFVYYREAIRASAEALDLDKAFDFAERLAESYNTKGVRYKYEAFNIARKLVKDAEQASAIAEKAYELTADLYITGDFSSALKIAADAKSLPKLPKDVSQKITDLEAEVKQVDNAEKTLMTTPDDAKANTTVARYAAFRRDKFDEAKEYAKKGNDQVLMDLIDAELSKPDTSESQFLLGKKYFDAQKKMKGFEKDQYIMRAQHWLNEAKGRANALTQGEIEKMLKEMGPNGNIVDLLKMVDVEKDSIVGKWSFQGGALVSPMGEDVLIRLPYKPPREYDLTIKLEAKDTDRGIGIGLSKGDIKFLYSIDSFPEIGFFSGIYIVDDKKIQNRENDDTKKSGRVMIRNKPATITCKVRENRLTVTVDGNVVTDWRGDFKRFSSQSNNHAGHLFISAWNVKYHITEITLKPISGKGGYIR